MIQTLRALAEMEGPEACDAIARRADLPAVEFDGMIPEAWFMRLVQALREVVPWPRSEAVLRCAGGYTADYVSTKRIPGMIRWLLNRLPARLALRLLLAGFARHAWTFAGSGRFRVEGSFPGVIVLEDCPTCRSSAAHTISGAYYEAAFEGLLHLAAPGAQVEEVTCLSRGASCCRFLIQLDGAPQPGETSCASY